MEDDVEEDTVDKVLSDLENLDTAELRLMCSWRNLSSAGERSDFLIRLKSFFGLESIDVENESKPTLEKGKVHIFWEGHKILRNLHLLTACTVVKSKVKSSQNFVAFSEYMNFTFL